MLRKGVQLKEQSPWTHWDEWNDVYRWLFSDNKSDNIKAIKRISAWENRCPVPLALSTSATIVEIQINDRIDVGWPTEFGHSENEKSLLYSMALSRMVNGLVAPYHGNYAASIRDVATKLKLPSILVELRHQASHREHVPSLCDLRSAARLALDWLKKNYWEHQKKQVHNAQTEISSLCKSYFSIMKKEQDSKRESTQLKEIVRSLLSVSHTNINSILIPTLLDKSLLVPKAKNCVKFKVLPNRLKNIWWPLIKKLSENRPDFIKHLLLLMVYRITESKTLNEDEKFRIFYNSLLICWFDIILNKICLKTSTKTKDPSSGASEVNKLKIPSGAIIKMCGRKIDKWTIKILRRIKPYTEQQYLEKLDTYLRFFDMGQYIRRTERNLPQKRNREPFLSQFLETELDVDDCEKVLESRKKRKLVVTEGELSVFRSEQQPQLNTNPCGWKLCEQEDDRIFCWGSYVDVWKHQIVNLDLPSHLDDEIYNVERTKIATCNNSKVTNNEETDQNIHVDQEEDEHTRQNDDTSTEELYQIQPILENTQQLSKKINLLFKL